TLGLCSQIDLDSEVKKAARRLEREKKDQQKPTEKGGTLLPASETTVAPGLGPQPDVEIMPPVRPEAPREETEAEEQARVLAKLRELGATKAEERSEYPLGPAPRAPGASPRLPAGPRPRTGPSSVRPA